MSDKARLDWLEKHQGGVHYNWMRCQFSVFTPSGASVHGDTLRQTIDMAMMAPKQPPQRG